MWDGDGERGANGVQSPASRERRTSASQPRRSTPTPVWCWNMHVPMDMTSTGVGGSRGQGQIDWFDEDVPCAVGSREGRPGSRTAAADMVDGAANPRTDVSVFHNDMQRIPGGPCMLAISDGQTFVCTSVCGKAVSMVPCTSVHGGFMKRKHRQETVENKT